MHSLITMLFVIFYMGLLAISNAYVNVALNKPVYQQYQWKPGDDRYDASNAVDGRKSDLRRDGGQCAISYSRKTATWWVNLTSIHSIHHITIYFRTDNSDDQFRSLIAGYVLGLSVYVSNTTDRSQGTLCFKDENFTRNTIPSLFTTNCFVNGQYVIFYNERLPGVVYPHDYYRNVWSDLCEVEVYDRRLNERNIEFYSLIGALGLATIIIIVLIIYQRMKRRNHKNQSTDDTPLRHTAAVANPEGDAFGSYMDSVEHISCHLYAGIQKDKM